MLKEQNSTLLHPTELQENTVLVEESPLQSVETLFVNEFTNGVLNPQAPFSKHS